MEENEKKEEQIIENQEDEIYVKERDTSFRSKRKPTPNYEYNPNPMDPNKDGKNGKMYKIFSFLSRSTLIGLCIGLVAMVVFVFIYISGLYDFDSVISGRKTPYATVMISQEYGETFYAKSYKSSSNMYKEYEAYPENNPKILFFLSHTMEPSGRHKFRDNYLSKAYDYYISEYTGDLSGLSISTEGDKPEIILDVSYENLDEELEKLYDLKQYLISKSISFEKLTFTLKLDHFYETTDCGKYLVKDTTLNQFLITEKNFYILYLDENGFDLSEISHSDIQNYKPSELEINLSYKKIPTTTTVAVYDYSKHDYMIDMTKVVPFIKNAEFINEDNMIFTIDGTEYKTEKQITKREFEKTFNAYIKLDIKNKSMTIYFND